MNRLTPFLLLICSCGIDTVSPRDTAAVKFAGTWNMVAWYSGKTLPDTAWGTLWGMVRRDTQLTIEPAEHGVKAWRTSRVQYYSPTTRAFGDIITTTEEHVGEFRGDTLYIKRVQDHPALLNKLVLRPDGTMNTVCLWTAPSGNCGPASDIWRRR